jgi:hypothetical protein
VIGAKKDPAPAGRQNARSPVEVPSRIANRNRFAKSVLETARAYVDAGLSVVPVCIDGTKRPLIAWKDFCTRRASDAELSAWCQQPVGLGIVCGIVSGGLEVFDFDDGSLWCPWYKSVESIACRLPTIETPSGGYHVYFRCREIGRNLKIATDPKADRQTLVETRGEGGYVIAPGGAPGVHQAGEYVQAQGPPLPEVPTIAPYDRRLLWAAARRFDRAAVKHRPLRPPTSFHRRTEQPAASWADILEPHGWASHDGRHWTRPGKQFGTSAAIVENQIGEEVLCVFSTSCGPLSADAGHKLFSKRQALRALEAGR